MNTSKEERLSLRHTYDSAGFLTLKPFKIRRIEERDGSEPRKMNLVTHNYDKVRHVNEIRHTHELEKKRSFEPLLMSLQSLYYNHSIPLFHWYLD